MNLPGPITIEFSTVIRDGEELIWIRIRQEGRDLTIMTTMSMELDTPECYLMAINACLKEWIFPSVAEPGENNSEIPVDTDAN